MACLTCQVEQQVMAADEVAQTVLVSNVGDVDPDAVSEVRDIEQVAAIFRYQAVHDLDVGSLIHQSAGQMGADEAKPSGYQDPLAGEVAHRPVAEKRKPL